MLFLADGAGKSQKQPLLAFLDGVFDFIGGEFSARDGHRKSPARGQNLASQEYILQAFDRVFGGEAFAPAPLKISHVGTPVRPAITREGDRAIRIDEFKMAGKQRVLFEDPLLN